MERKIYKLLSAAKQSLFALGVILFAGSAYSQVTYSLNFTGSIQTLTLTAGNWGIECWGASGGSITSAGGGGIGGYSIGQINCTSSGSILNVYVGGRGNPATGTSPSAGSGGWNGGGGGAAVGRSGAGGGGASDVRLNGIATFDRIIVAGGGGGAAYYGSSLFTASVAAGGNGGGAAGQNGNYIASSGLITVGGGGNGANGATPGSAAVSTASGSTCGAGGGGSSAGSSVGQPGNCGGAGGAAGPSAGGATGSAGGGGGGYTGGAGGVQGSFNAGVAGGGGSGYVGGMTSAFTYSPGQLGFVTNPVTNGHGYVIIRELCNITMSVAGVNANNAICTPNSVTLTTNAIGNYNWSNGNTTSSVVVVSPTVTTVYSVTATSSLNCTASTAFTVFVNGAVPALTVANTASASGGICPNATVTLTGSGATTYTWTGGVSNGVSFGPTTPSTYIVSGSNACGTSTAVATISVHPLPSVSAVVSQPTVCSGIPSNLTGVGNATNYVWTGGVPNGQNFFPTTTSSYTVIGTSALGCTNSAIASVTVVTTPLAPALPSPPLICIGNSATITSQGATTYSWITPSGILSGSLITVSPNVTTTYTLTKSNSNCVNTQTVQVIVNNLPPVSAFAQPTIICASTTASLFGAGALTYTWNAGGTPVFTLGGASPLVSPSVTTIYTLTASDGTCVNTTTVEIATNPNPTLQIVPTSTNICRGDQVSMTVSGALGYSWTTVGITSNTNAATISETPTSSVVYIVTGTNNFNCNSSAQQVVVVRPTPTLQIGTTKPLVCTGAPSSMTVSSSPGSGVSPCTYVWSLNASAATTSVVTVNPLTTTSYTAVGLAPNGCTSTVNYPISVFLPTFAVNSPTSSCQGGTVILTGTGANTYTWNGNQPFQSIPVSPPGPTVYFVAATSNSNGVNCISTKSVQVTIYNNPTVTAVATRTQVCKTESTTILGGGATTYTLHTGDAGTLITVYPVGNATTYTLTGTDQNGCIGTTTIQIKTSICFGIEEQGLASRLGLNLYPNPSNGSFYVSTASDVNVRVENELGQLIALYELNAENQRKVNINGLASGVYFVTLTKDGEQSTQKVIVTK